MVNQLQDFVIQVNLTCSILTTKFPLKTDVAINIVKDLKPLSPIISKNFFNDPPPGVIFMNSLKF